MEGRKQIEIIPYMVVDGIRTYKDSEITALYNKVWTDGIGETVFFDGSIKDADHFVQLMKSDSNYLHIIYCRAKLAAMAWINRIEKTNANCHWLFFREWWGQPEIYEIGTTWLTYLIKEYNFELIYGLVPASNNLARRYMTKLGLKDLGEIPGILWSEKDQQAVPGRYFYMTREMLDAV